MYIYIELSRIPVPVPTKTFSWLPVFLEKVHTTGTNQSFIMCCRYFSYCYLFVSL